MSSSSEDISIGPKFYFQLDKMEGIDNYSDFSRILYETEILLNYFSFTGHLYV